MGLLPVGVMPAGARPAFPPCATLRPGGQLTCSYSAVSSEARHSAVSCCWRCRAEPALADGTLLVMHNSGTAHSVACDSSNATSAT